jgi:hypothetical protein
VGCSVYVTCSVRQSCHFGNRGSDCVGTHDPCHLGTTATMLSSAMMHTLAWWTNQMRTPIQWQRCTTTPTVKTKFQKSYAAKEMLAPPAGSQPLPRWARGPLLVPCIPGTPVYRLQAKTKSRGCTHALLHATVAPEPASLLWKTPVLPRVPRLQTPPLRLGGSGAATCPEALDSVSPSRRALTLPCVPRHRTPPRRLGGLGR